MLQYSRHSHSRKVPRSGRTCGSRTSFTLMTFLTSIILGLTMGSSVLFSIRYGEKNDRGLEESISASFVFIIAVTVILNAPSYILLGRVRAFMRIEDDGVSAVDYESQDPHGAGPCKQLRSCRNGGFCSLCQNRCVCIHAAPGLRQCILDIHCTEQGSREKGKNT